MSMGTSYGVAMQPAFGRSTQQKKGPKELMLADRGKSKGTFYDSARGYIRLSIQTFYQVYYNPVERDPQRRPSKPKRGPFVLLRSVARLAGPLWASLALPPSLCAQRTT